MTALFSILLLLIFAACVGFSLSEGMWSNAIRFVNVMTAALLATNYWEPVARLIEGSITGSLTFYCDMFSLWGLFALFTLVFRMATSAVSHVRVRFKKIVERIGNWVFAAAVGWVMVCFVTFSLHTAPLCRKFLFEGFDPEAGMFFGLAPDRQWLSLVECVSGGAFSNDPESVFDPQHQFINKYALRRDEVEGYRTAKRGFWVDSVDYPSALVHKR
jgi:hypothetical protein